MERYRFQEQPLSDVLQNGYFENFAIFTGKHLCWSRFFHEAEDL